MKKLFMVIGFVVRMLPVYLHAGTEGDLKGAYQPATVVIVSLVRTSEGAISLQPPRHPYATKSLSNREVSVYTINLL
jgi:hypothetical protein